MSYQDLCSRKKKVTGTSKQAPTDLNPDFCSPFVDRQKRKKSESFNQYRYLVSRSIFSPLWNLGVIVYKVYVNRYRHKTRRLYHRTSFLGQFVQASSLFESDLDICIMKKVYYFESWKKALLTEIQIVKKSPRSLTRHTEMALTFQMQEYNWPLA